MKLEKCRTCSGAVARLAEACPHCGQPSPVSAVLRLKLLAIGVIALIIVIIAAFIISKSNEFQY